MNSDAKAPGHDQSPPSGRLLLAGGAFLDLRWTICTLCALEVGLAEVDGRRVLFDALEAGQGPEGDQIALVVHQCGRPLS